MGSLAERDLAALRSNRDFRKGMDHHRERLVIMERLAAAENGAAVGDLLADTHLSLDDLAEIVAEMRGYGHNIELAVVPAAALTG